MKSNIKYQVPNIKLKVAVWQLFFGFLLFVSGQSVAQKNKPYHEDLSKLRPKFEEQIDAKIEKDTSQEKKFMTVTPTKNVNSKVDAVLDSLDLFNLMRKYIDGYTIQIYSGQKREDAMNTKKKMQE